MPLKNATASNGLRYYQWGDHGARYFYESGNKKQRRLAKRRAIKQAIAIAHSQGINPHEYISEHNNIDK